MNSSVPAHLVGLWRRRSLLDANGCDRTTEVYWLQTHSLYADLRLPPGRPGFSGCTGVNDLDEEQLGWLAQQQGFAGRLRLDENVATWVREIDFQPPARVADVGRLDLRGARLVEHGVLTPYTEEWIREEGPVGPVLALALSEESIEQHTLPQRQGIVVAVGEHFMHARARSVQLPAGTRLHSLLENDVSRGVRERLLLECVIDYGRLRGETCPWQILRSTQPWREGGSLLELELTVRHQQPDSVETIGVDGVRRRWRVVEGNDGLLRASS